MQHSYHTSEKIVQVDGAIWPCIFHVAYFHLNQSLSIGIFTNLNDMAVTCTVTKHQFFPLSYLRLEQLSSWVNCRLLMSTRLLTLQRSQILSDVHVCSLLHPHIFYEAVKRAPIPINAPVAASGSSVPLWTCKQQARVCAATKSTDCAWLVRRCKYHTSAMSIHRASSTRRRPAPCGERYILGLTSLIIQGEPLGL